MKPALRHIISTVFLLILLAWLSVFLGVSAKKKGDAVCNGLKVTVLDSAKNSFVSSGEICSYLGKELGEIIGKPLGDLDLTAIENMVDAGSAVLKSEAYTTSDGYLNVLVTQREPAVRFQGGTGGFYADRNGYVFPLQRNYTSDVPVIDGYIPVKIPAGYKGEVPDETGRKWLQDILDMTGFMDRSRVWARNIVQISVQEDGDIIMIPREGKEKFIFGSPEGFEEKFGRMEKYYTAVKPSKEEGYYSSVNVKYEGQIICRR